MQTIGAVEAHCAPIVVAFQGLERFDPSRDFGSWLFGIARNQLGKAECYD